MSSPAAEISRACNYLEQGRLSDALRTLEGAPGADGVVGSSVSLIIRGLILEREGNAADADRCFERVFTQGVPLPVLLQETGKYFKRRGQFDKAYGCYSVLQNFVSHAITEFLDGLPPAELSRYAPLVVKRMLSNRQPLFYSLQPIKEALASELGAEAAAVAYAEMAGLEPGWDVAHVRLAGLQDFAKEHGLVYEELSTGRVVDLPPLPVFGDSEPTGTQARTRAVFFCVLADTIVSSKSNLLIAGDRALLDYQTPLEAGPLNLDVDPIALAPADGGVTVVIGREAASGPELEEAFPLVGVHSYNYGHWLIELLPRVLACRDRPGFNSVPILIDEQMIPQHREALELLVGREQPVIVLKRGEAVRVKKLWTCSMFVYFPLGPKPGEWDRAGVSQSIDGQAFADLIRALGPALRAIPQPSGPKRIYLTRKDSQHRRLVNRVEVEAWFSGQGFEIFDPAELSFATQLALVRGADLIVGPDGSGLWSAFLACPGSAVGYLNNPYLEDHWWIAALCQSLGLHLSILTGEVVRQAEDYREFSDYRIHVNALPGFLEGLLSAP